MTLDLQAQGDCNSNPYLVPRSIRDFVIIDRHGHTIMIALSGPLRAFSTYGE